MRGKIQNQLQNTERHQQQTASCSTTHPSEPAVRSVNIPTYAEQLANLKLHVQPPESKPTTSSLSITQPNSTKQEIPPSPKPQTHRKKLQPSVDFNHSDSDDSSMHRDKTLLKNNSFLESTLKNLPDLTCSKPRQPDYMDLPFPNPKQMENDDDTIQP